MIRVYSTLSEKKEPLPRRRPLRMFVCGITTYDYPHIGNGRTFMAFDLFARYLRAKKVKLFFLQNITDIDDKIIVRAQNEGASWKSVSRKFEKVYFNDMKALGIDTITEFARATDHIPEIVKQVKTLIKKGNVYEIPGDGWYFELKTFPEYGKLARRTVEQAEDGVSRIDESSGKRGRGDFCVWKYSKPGEPIWKTELGSGRPGWHIEDTAITEYFFGPQYDIHGGGLDIKFPHHEAEIAQQESASGKKPFVKIWMHAGLILVNGEKMSKSKGNFLTIQDLLARHAPETFRMMTVAHHYRSPMNYTETVAESAKKNVEDIRVFAAKLELVEKNGAGTDKLALQKYSKNFHAALEDDFNTPQALAAIFELMSAANKNIWQLSKRDARAAREFVLEALGLWGFRNLSPKIPRKAVQVAKKREIARKRKDFAESDALRTELESLGYRNEDTPLGALLLPK